MEVRDLRIGNKLMNISGFVGTVTYIGDDDTVKLVNKDGVLLDWMRADIFLPIPLTEEILLKCGFVREGHLRFSIMFNIENSTDSDWDKIYCDTKNFDIEQSIDNEVRKVYFNENCKHLHQLQNLYFALTNQELNIEL